MSAHPRGRGRGRGHQPEPPPRELARFGQQRGFVQFRLPPVVATPAEIAGHIRAEAAQLAAGEAAPEAPTQAAFDAIRAQLAQAKSALDSIPPQEFKRFVRATDLYYGLKRELTATYNMQFATNASAKMFEMLVQMRLVTCPAGPLPRVRAFCNAELPGAFVATINHWVRTMCPGSTFEWLASSLAPAAAPGRGRRPGKVFDDYHGIYAANRGRWLMGPRPNGLPDDSPLVDGDLTRAETVVVLANAVHARFAAGDAPSGATLYTGGDIGGDIGGGDIGGAAAAAVAAAPGGATLYTGDAGCDVSRDYNRQEEATALLNYGQVLCGLMSLAPGGALVTKMYTFFTRFSRGLIALVAASFDEAYITKPLASRPANSEVYLVGKGFRGLSLVAAEALVELMGAPPETLAARSPLPLAACAAVDETLLRAARSLYERSQATFLREVVALYPAYRDRPGDLRAALAREAATACERWLDLYAPRRIRRELTLEERPADAAEPGDADDSE